MNTNGRYTVHLWDHDEQKWSETLASAHLEGPSSGLSWRGIGLAMRLLRGWWDDVAILVVCENGHVGGGVEIPGELAEEARRD